MPSLLRFFSAFSTASGSHLSTPSFPLTILLIVNARQAADSADTGTAGAAPRRRQPASITDCFRRVPPPFATSATLHDEARRYSGSHTKQEVHKRSQA